MDNRSAFFDGQTRYFLEINGSAVKPDVLRFRGREALSEPFPVGHRVHLPECEHSSGRGADEICVVADA